MKCSSCLQRIDLQSRLFSQSRCDKCGTAFDKVRALVFLVIVRQALAGAPWQELCAGVMQTNNITQQEVIDELHNQPPADEPLAAAAAIPRPIIFKDYTAKRRGNGPDIKPVA